MRGMLMGLLLAAGALSARPARAQETGMVIIVNTFNPFIVIRADDLSRMFLKKAAVWANGQPAYPVDQRESSPLRRRFITRVLNKDQASLRSYWQEMVFSGKAVPPPALDSDAAVIDFVRHNPYAVGYVSASAQLGDDVRVIPVVR
jgi:ABC-type phosphate transport system substrate-binding protein